MATKQTTKRSPQPSAIRTIDQLAALLDLPSWDDIDELNQEHYWEEARAAMTGSDVDPEDVPDEEAFFEAEQKARDEVYGQWHNAVIYTVGEFFDAYDLRVVPVRKSGEHPYDFKIEPEVSWDRSADLLRQIINGVGLFTFYTLKEFLDSGPYTARQAVLAHLGWIKSYSDVYGTKSARRMYDGAW